MCEYPHSPTTDRHFAPTLPASKLSSNDPTSDDEPWRAWRCTWRGRGGVAPTPVLILGLCSHGGGVPVPPRGGDANDGTVRRVRRTFTGIDTGFDSADGDAGSRIIIRN